jgi:uncharacterized protein (TIGR04255 family)
MKIAASGRVVYQNNPLSEVICQLRFGRIVDFPDTKRDSLRNRYVALGYTNCGEEHSFGFQQQFGPDGRSVHGPVAMPSVRIDHCTSVDGAWRVSFCPEFIAITCLRYSGWNEFLPRVLDVAREFVTEIVGIKPTRLGLRYRDVVEREPIGLEGVPWHELIQPFLLGPIAINALCDDQSPQEADVVSFLSQAQLKIDDSLLLLQSSLMSSIDGQRQAFLVDADFFHEESLENDLISNSSVLSSRLEKLHTNAGGLFRRSITERLHHALKPST